MITVGRLAKKYGLSRTTLLYYHSIGLLKPSGRSGADYRLYSSADEARLDRICRLRGAGVQLEEIARLLDGPPDVTTEVLERRLLQIQDDMDLLHEQRTLVLALLQRRPSLSSERPLDKAGWVKILTQIGFDEAQMTRWHRAFERISPDEHQRFLEYLRIPPAEVAAIRAWSLAADEACRVPTPTDAGICD